MKHFGLSEHMLRPYSGKHLDVLNYRLSRARRCIECAFGILSNKCRILHRPLNTSVHFAEDIVKACCTLHNFVRQRDGYNFHDSLHVRGFEDIADTDMEKLRVERRGGREWLRLRWSNAPTSSETRPLPQRVARTGRYGRRVCAESIETAYKIQTAARGSHRWRWLVALFAPGLRFPSGAVVSGT
jgi:hypothetical protein